MDPALLLFGVLLLIWPIHFRWTVSGIGKRLAARGDDPEPFRRSMDRPLIRAGLIAAPIGGVILIVLGLSGG